MFMMYYHAAMVACTTAKGFMHYSKKPKIKSGIFMQIAILHRALFQDKALRNKSLFMNIG